MGQLWLGIWSMWALGDKLVFRVWLRSLSLAIQLAFGRIAFSMPGNEISALRDIKQSFIFLNLISNRACVCSYHTVIGGKHLHLLSSSFQGNHCRPTCIICGAREATPNSILQMFHASLRPHYLPSKQLRVLIEETSIRAWVFKV